MTLYLFEGYSNYYNRIIKKYDTVGGYIEWARDNEKGMYSFETMNFNPNDDVNTEHVFNLNSGCRPDYVVAVNELDTIVSRWFIIESVRVRGGQYRCTLRRDLVADYYEEIIKAPCFIEKATLSKYDPMIFNSENMSFNQIKKNEWLLQDETKTAWIVGYLNRTLTEDKNISVQLPAYYDLSYTTLDDFEPYTLYTSTAENLPKTYNTIRYQAIWKYDYEGNQSLLTCNESGAQIELSKTIALPTSYSQNPLGNATVESFLASELSYNLRQYLNSMTRGIFLDSNLYDIKQYDNKIIKVGTETFTYYKISVKNRNITGRIENILNRDYSTLYNTVFNSNYITMDSSATTFSRTGLRGKNDFTEFYLEFEDITSSYVTTVDVTIPAIRNQLLDAPYDMFCIPVSPITLGSTTYSVDNVQGICSEIYTQLGGGSANSNIFDIQYLPYCPLENYINIKMFGLSELIENFDYTLIKSNNVVKSVMFFPKKSSFTTKIVFTISIEDLSATELKVSNECTMYRLCSPNYNGVFEFSPFKNGGVQYFEINCTYKPFNPYIHINPNWGNLYGSDFNDARGLILGGDFSIAALSSAWEQYQLQNKNYEAIFNREIQSMELKNSLGVGQDITKAITGTITGSASGAMSGAMMSGGNPYAAIAGGVIGGTASLVGGLADVSINQQLRTDALDYTKDMYSYNLGNIQALPNSLSKSSAFDINNKIFPFLEFYTCTEIEKDALRNKLKYNGMTVMRIDKIENFIQSERSYIKGSLIRYEDICDDTHILNSIADELYKGVFI